MTDKELLELAAKAAGKEIEWKKCASHIDDYELTAISGPWVNGLWWNPLTDDGDALRLAVKLKMNIEIDGVSVIATSFGIENVHRVTIKLSADADKYMATRSAIVCAAAEIGKTL